MNDNNTMNTQQQTTPTPEETGGAGRMFSQEEVNRIVADRLSRERERLAHQAEQDERERRLEQREQALKAREDRATKTEAVKAYYQSKNITGKALDVAMKGSSAEIDALELEDGKIKDYSSIDGLIGGVFAPLVSVTTTVGANTATPPANTGGSDRIANVFKPKI